MGEPDVFAKNIAEGETGSAPRIDTAVAQNRAMSDNYTEEVMTGAAVEHRLHSLVRRAVGDPRSDAELLALIREDHAAFAELVTRHGPLVWGVCRHLLSEADAEDAFQATFLALLRSTIRDRAALASWLHGTALRVSLATRREAGRRRTRERVASVPEPVGPREPDDWADTMAVVHREVAALPEADRAAFILCVLEGRTQAETAARLELSPGAVAGQVARAKKRLVARLTGRGVVPGLAALGTASVAVAVPPSVVQRVLGLPGAGVPPAVGRLVTGVLGMTAPSTKLVLVAVALAATLAAGVLAGIGPVPEGPAPAGARAPDPDVPPGKSPAQPAAGAADRPVRLLLGHKDRVTSVAYSPDGRWIATAGLDGTVRLWEAKTGKEERRLDVPATKRASPARLSHVLFSPDSEFVVVSQQADPEEAGVTVWNRRTGEKVREFRGLCAAVSPDGKHIACGGWGTTDPARCGIRICEFATGKQLRELSGQQAVVVSLIFSPDGRTLVSKGPRPTHLSGIEPCIVCIWDVGTGKERRSGSTEVPLAEHLALAPDGRTLALTSRAHASGGDVILRELATGGQRAKLVVGRTDDDCAVAFSPDGRTLALASTDKTVRLWDIASGKEIDSLKGHSDWVLSVAFSPDGRTLVSSGSDQKSLVWDVSKIASRPRVSAERSLAELGADWKDLAGDAPKGYAALGRFVSSPESAIPFLGKRLETAAAADTKPIERLVGTLDDEEFQVRERATKDLAAMGDRAAPTLRTALAGGPSPEAKRRLETLLARVESAGPSAETVREVRAVEALESIGTAKAQRVLAALAAGPPGMRLTQEAKASAGRLARP